MKATIKMIAKAADVSVATVSMVLNKKDERISPHTRQKILGIAEALHYQPNAIARSLVTAQTRTVGLLIPDVANPFFAEVAKCIEVELSAANYNLFLCNSGNDQKKEKAYLYELLSRNIDGLIIASAHVEEMEMRQMLEALKTPFVVFDRHCGNSTFCEVSVDDRKGGVLAAEELLAGGHRSAVCLCGSLSYRNIRERVEGFTQTWKQRAVFREEWIFASQMTIQSGYESAQRFLREVPAGSVTAVFCANDLIAFGAYKAFKEAGLMIPDDISVVGFDNIAFSEYLMPSLTTVAQPIAAIGKKTAQMVLELIGNTESAPQNHVFPVEILRRQSVRY